MPEFCWSTSANPTTADYTRSLSDLPFYGDLTRTFEINGAPNTTYYVRAYYTSYSAGSSGIVYGNELRFKTYTGSLTDIDGNKYNTVTIGDQLWMAENLRTTKYNDNTPIPLVTGNSEWTAMSGPGFSWYNNDPASYKTRYGALYNWYTLDDASNGGKNVCPIGWQVPSDEEWTTLSDYLSENGYGYDDDETDIAKSMAAVVSWDSESCTRHTGK